MSVLKEDGDETGSAVGGGGWVGDCAGVGVAGTAAWMERPAGVVLSALATCNGICAEEMLMAIHPKRKLRRGPGWPPPSGNAPSLLLEQLQDSLLLLVGLGQGGDAGLFQDLVLGHVGHNLSDVCVLDAAE